MSNPISGGQRAADAANTAAQTARRTDAAGEGSQAMIDSARQMGVLNAELLARDLAKVVAADPKRGADLLAEIKPQLSAADQKNLTRELAEELDAKLAKQQTELALDLTQIGLSIVGIFEPTPISDGLDGLISVFRGDWLGAGISVVSMIPYVGDVAKLGKLGKFAETIAKAVDLAKLDPGFAKAVKPALDKIADALKHVPVDSLPKAAREAIESMKKKLDEFAAPAARGADDVLPGAVRVTPDDKGLINGAKNGAPNAPWFSKWDGSVRYDKASDTYAYGKTMETAGYGTRNVEIPYKKGADGVARPDFSAYTRDTVHIDTSLPKKYTEHFKAANEVLAGKLKADPGLASRLGLTPQQAEHIMKQPPLGTSPSGLTWHHGENGAMHLVDANVHGTFTHQGGMSTWGK